MPTSDLKLASPTRPLEVAGGKMVPSAHVHLPKLFMPPWHVKQPQAASAVTAVFISVGGLFTCLYIGVLQIFVAGFIVTARSETMGPLQ